MVNGQGVLLFGTWSSSRFIYSTTVRIFLLEYIFEFATFVFPFMYVFIRKEKLKPLFNSNINEAIEKLYGKKVDVFEEKNNYPNVFVGGTLRNPSLSFSTGFLEKFVDKKYIEAAVSHELSHVINRDVKIILLLKRLKETFLIYCLIFFIYIFVLLTFWITSPITLDLLSAATPSILQFTLILIYLFFFNLAVNAILKTKEYLADYTVSSYFSKKRELMELIVSLPDKTGKLENLMGYFSDHPSQSNRINNLKQNYNIGKINRLFLFGSTLAIVNLASIDLIIMIITYVNYYFNIYKNTILLNDFLILIFYFVYLLVLPSMLITYSYFKISLTSRFIYSYICHILYSLIFLIYFLITYFVEMLRRILEISSINIPKIASFKGEWFEYLTWTRYFMDNRQLTHFLFSINLNGLFINGFTAWIYFTILLFIISNISNIILWCAYFKFPFFKIIYDSN